MRRNVQDSEERLQSGGLAEAGEAVSHREIEIRAAVAGGLRKVIVAGLGVEWDWKQLEFVAETKDKSVSGEKEDKLT